MDWPAPQPHTHPPTPSPQLSALPSPPHPPAFTAPLASTSHAAQPFFSPPLNPSRPRLKRSHPTAHSALPSGPTPAPQPVPTSPTGGASPLSHARTRSTSSNASLSTLEPIKEWPGAEGEGTSSLGLNLGVQQKSRVEDDGTLERAPKRVRVAPDHEAFGRLSLSTAAGGPASPTTLTYSPLSTVPSTLPTPFTTGGAPPPTPLLLNTSHLPPSTLTPVSFPPSAPSSAASSSFHPQPHAPSSSPPISAPSLPAAPPTSPVQSASTSGLRSPIRGAGAGTSLPTVPWSQSSFISPPPPPTSLATEQAGQAEEIDMRSASSSWPTGPHTIYVSSLDSDSDTEAPAPVKEVEVNPLALRGGTDDPASRLLLSKLHEAAHSSSSSAGELILYRPPPSFAPPPPLSSPEPELEAESAKSRILRERRAKRTSDEWGEFVRMREREEAMHDFGDEEEPAVVEEDGMEMD
ncbi:hypothetical protein RTBOTA2_004999 [Rhodotorula toruloides]|uniref:Uncharacterized protein n=1 Tax=Rhodotorula toruloides TaxID=5286 RepID=A0A2T0A8Z4_RHOTO|nr:hypothetical protein RTBOTA2_004999 [Rhodotorula toruloides]PRQ74481.1 hypothetical protein AAT19DRAFT_14834 [Rhodotorula toruloides]